MIKEKDGRTYRRLQHEHVIEKYKTVNRDKERHMAADEIYFIVSEYQSDEENDDKTRALAAAIIDLLLWTYAFAATALSSIETLSTSLAMLLSRLKRQKAKLKNATELLVMLTNHTPSMESIKLASILLSSTNVVLKAGQRHKLFNYVFPLLRSEDRPLATKVQSILCSFPFDDDERMIVKLLEMVVTCTLAMDIKLTKHLLLSARRVRVTGQLLCILLDLWHQIVCTINSHFELAELILPFIWPFLKREDRTSFLHNPLIAVLPSLADDKCKKGACLYELVLRYEIEDQWVVHQAIEAGIITEASRSHSLLLDTCFQAPGRLAAALSQLPPPIQRQWKTTPFAPYTAERMEGHLALAVVLQRTEEIPTLFQKLVAWNGSRAAWISLGILCLLFHDKNQVKDVGAAVLQRLLPCREAKEQWLLFFLSLVFEDSFVSFKHQLEIHDAIIVLQFLYSFFVKDELKSIVDASGSIHRLDYPFGTLSISNQYPDLVYKITSAKEMFAEFFKTLPNTIHAFERLLTTEEGQVYTALRARYLLQCMEKKYFAAVLDILFMLFEGDVMDAALIVTWFLEDNSEQLAQEAAIWIRQTAGLPSAPHPLSVDGLGYNLVAAKDIFSEDQKACTNSANAKHIEESFFHWHKCRISAFNNNWCYCTPESPRSSSFIYPQGTILVPRWEEVSLVQGFIFSDIIHPGSSFENQFGALLALQLTLCTKHRSLRSTIAVDSQKFSRWLLAAIDSCLAALFLLAYNASEPKKMLTDALEQLCRSVGLTAYSEFFTTSTMRCWNVLWGLATAENHPSLRAIYWIYSPPLMDAVDAFKACAPNFTSKALPQVALGILLNSASLASGDVFCAVILAVFAIGLRRCRRLHRITITDEILQPVRQALTIALDLGGDKEEIHRYLCCFRPAEIIPPSSSKRATGWIGKLVFSSSLLFAFSENIAAIVQDSIFYLNSLSHTEKPYHDNDLKLLETNYMDFLHAFVELVITHEPTAFIPLIPCNEFEVAGIWPVAGRLLLKVIQKHFYHQQCNKNPIQGLGELLEAIVALPRERLDWTPAETLYVHLALHDIRSDNVNFDIDRQLAEVPEILGNDILPLHLETENIPAHLHAHLSSWECNHQPALQSYELDVEKLVSAVDTQSILAHKLLDFQQVWTQGHRLWAIARLRHALKNTPALSPPLTGLGLLTLACWTAEAGAASNRSIRRLFVESEKTLDDSSTIFSAALYGAWGNWAARLALNDEMWIEDAMKCLAAAIQLQRDDEKRMAMTLRFVQLWFCKTDQVDSWIPKLVSSTTSLSSFLPFAHQLAARMVSEKSSTRGLYYLYEVLVYQHPFVALYPLFYVTINAKHDEQEPTQIETAPGQLLEKLRSGSLSEAVYASMKLVEASVELGIRALNESTPKKRNFLFTLDDSWKIVRLTKAGGISAPPLTAEDHSIHIVGWAMQGKVMGGIRAPKALVCYGSDGKSYPQLFKARDDLRQDAVVLQVMRMLAGDSWRTYPVIPLQKHVGVIGMIDHCVALGDWLLDAHKRLRPTDIRPEDALCRMAAFSARKGACKKDQLQAFQEICAQFSPVLRFFFWEGPWSSTSEWLQARVKYSASVGATAIIGWIVGLGDRHPQNILISKKTAEVVHIDLNLIFEAGQMLAIPERVPFRFTADIRDGLLRPFILPKKSLRGYASDEAGIHGWDDDELPLGVFGRAAERTLVELQKRREFICMLFEAFQYDPLYVQWRTSPQRSLERIKEKLTPKLSPITQVNVLVREAMNEQALAAMFHGWQAWM